MDIYDPPTRLWTTVLAVLVAAILDWIAIVMPVQSHPPDPIHTNLWAASLVLAFIVPGSWTIGRIRRADFFGTVVWFCVAALMVILQLTALKWGNGQPILGT